MHKGYIKTAAILGVLAVIIGAFGAHKMKEFFSDYAVGIFETGVRYHFYHVFALLAVGILYKEYPNKFIRWAGILFITGIILFSTSLYLLSIVKGFVQPGYGWLGAITPVGGACFIIGWVLLFFGIRKRTTVSLLLHANEEKTQIPF